jgi:DNA (cytosine-5)-methyltransferase 1
MKPSQPHQHSDSALSYEAVPAATVKTRHRVISMFSGCGGMDLGFRGGFRFLGHDYGRLPFDIVWANELNEAASRTYRANFDHDIICDDVWAVLDTLPESADVLIGGFPCQDISVNNGKGKGVEGARSGLYRAMVEAVRRTQPMVFVAENVKGLLTKRNAASLECVLRDFRALGYDVTYTLFQTAHYGVPQTRERVMIVGTHPDAKKFTPPPASIASKENWVTAHAAIHDLEALPKDPLRSHIWSQAKKSPEQGSRYLKRDRPGYTIRAECHGNIQWHYKLPRRMSMREAARIQSFPDAFLFDAKIRETERMVGNAVPPVFGWHMANAVLACLDATST